MASEVESLYIKIGVDATQFNSSMQGIKKEIQLLNSTKFNMNVFTKEQALAIQTRIGDLKGRMEDLRIAQSSLDKGDVFGNMARLGGVAANAVGAVAGGMSLLGVKSEEVGKIETKVMTAIALGNTLQQLADAKRLKNIVLEYAADVKALAIKGAKLVADKLSFDMTNKQTVAEIAGNRAKTIGAVATQAITKAQWAWNAAMAANPVGIIVAAIVALVAAIYLLTKAFNTSTEAVYDQDQALKDASKQLDEYNVKVGTDAVKSQRDLAVATGEMTEAARKQLDLLDDLDSKRKDGIKTATEETSKIITESKKRQDAIKEEGAKRLIIINGIAINSKQVEEEVTKELKLEIERRNNLLNGYWVKFKAGQVDLKKTQSNESKIINLEEQKILNDKYKAYKDNYDNILKSAQEYIEKVGDENKKESILGSISSVDEWLSKNKAFIVEQTDLYNEGKIRLEDYNNKISELTDVRLKMLAFKYRAEMDLAKINLKISIDDDKKIYDEQVKSLKSLNQGPVLKKLLDDAKKTYEDQIKIKNDNFIVDYGTTEEHDNAKMWMRVKEEFDKTRKEKEKLNTDALEKDIQIQIQSNEKKIAVERQLWEGNLKIYKDFSKEEQSQIIDNIEKGQNEEIRLLYDNLIKKQNIIKKEIEDKKKLIIEQPQNADMYNQQIDDLIAQMDIMNVEFTMTKNDMTITWNGLIDEINPKTLTEQWVIDWETIMNGDDLELQIQKISEMASTAGQFIGDMINTSISAQQEALSISIDNSLKRSQEAYDTYMTGLDNSLKYGIINQETYNKEKLKAEKELSEKEKKLKTEQAAKEKQWNISRAIISGAQSVLSALATAPPMSYIMAALNATLAAYQISVIKQTPLPEFALGGMVNGPSHKSGGVPLVAEGGEFIVNRSVSQRPGMGDFLNKINTGQISSTTNINNGIDMDTMTQIIKETVNSITAIPVISVESESTRVQRKVNNIEKNSKW